MVYFVFFFFKQKTAYEMVRSDWSSDVCSSDLRRASTTSSCAWPTRPRRGSSTRTCWAARWSSSTNPSSWCRCASARRSSTCCRPRVRRADLGKVADALRARGVTVDGDVRDRRGAFGVGPSLYIRDLDGYMLELK